MRSKSARRSAVAWAVLFALTMKSATRLRSRALRLPKTILPGDGAGRAPARSRPVVRTGGTAAPDDALLDYLLGSDG